MQIKENKHLFTFLETLNKILYQKIFFKNSTWDSQAVRARIKKHIKHEISKLNGSFIIESGEVLTLVVS